MFAEKMCNLMNTRSTMGKYITPLDYSALVKFATPVCIDFVTIKLQPRQLRAQTQVYLYSSFFFFFVVFL